MAAGAANETILVRTPAYACDISVPLFLKFLFDIASTFTSAVNANAA
jgi:hypothetical protein